VPPAARKGIPTRGPTPTAADPAPPTGFEARRVDIFWFLFEIIKNIYTMLEYQITNTPRIY